MAGTDKEEAPLEAEAAKREEWRGGTDPGAQEAGGHSVPASESDAVSAEEGGAPAPRTISPPD